MARTFAYFTSFALPFLLFACGQTAPGSGDGPEYIEFGAAFSPDGGKIAFTSERNGNQDIYVMDADGGALTQITFSEADEQVHSWSPDGARMAICSNRDGNEEVYVIDADGSNPVNLTHHPADDCNPAWSPDGTKILFMTTRDGDWQETPQDNWEIYVMDADGSNQTRLTHTPGYDLSTGQAWSPDGQKIVFCSNFDQKYVKGPNRFDGFDLYIMDADGSDIRRLTFDEGQDSYAYWSPDGKTISYTRVEKGAPIEASGGQNYEIYLIDADGTHRRRLTDNPDFDFEGWWSPDGSKIAYSSSRDGPLGIHIMDADGDNKTRLTNIQ